MAGTTNDATDQIAREPHGAVGARAGRRAIAQANTSAIADALCRYSAPEEVSLFPQITRVEVRENLLLCISHLKKIRSVI